MCPTKNENFKKPRKNIEKAFEVKKAIFYLHLIKLIAHIFICVGHNIGSKSFFFSKFEKKV